MCRWKQILFVYVFREGVKKTYLLYRPVLNVLSPPPVRHHIFGTIFFFFFDTHSKRCRMVLNVCIFLWKKKNFFSKGKILKTISIFYENIGKKVFNVYPYENVTKMFCIFFRFRTFCIFFSLKKNLFWLQPGGWPPPRLRTGP